MIGNRNTQMEQKILFLKYREMINSNSIKFDEAGFRALSQNDEDGLLLYIFALIGFTNKKCIDIACGVPNNSNSANLILNWGFDGLLIDGDLNLVNKTKEYYKNHMDTWICAPTVLNQWITINNINEIISENGFDTEIDLLSLDIDGIDYWLWESINVVNPRVVVVEYMNIWDYTKAMTVGYKEDFNRFDYHEDFFGASLLAFKKLADKKGYILVGVNKWSFNAFFVKKELIDKIKYEVSVKDCLDNTYAKKANKERLPLVENMKWIEV